MHKLISVMFVAVGLCGIAAGADAAPACALDGTWTTTNAGGKATFTTKIDAAKHSITVDRTGGGVPNAHIDGTFTYDAASGKIVFTNTAVGTQDMAFFACLNVPGTYTVVFPDCTHLTLTLVSDQCGPRTQSTARATFTKQ
jgi:hypothetical protein